MELDENINQEKYLNKYKNVIEQAISKITSGTELEEGKMRDSANLYKGYIWLSAEFKGNEVTVDEDDFDEWEDTDADADGNVFHSGGWSYVRDMEEEAAKANEDYKDLYDLFRSFGWEQTEECWFALPDTDLEICAEPEFESVGDEPEVTDAWSDPGDYWNPPEGGIEFEPETYDTKVIIYFRVNP